MKYTKTFNEYLNERKNVITKKGSLMCYFKGNEDKWYDTISEMIDEKDLHENGLEDEPHTTILYGFLHDSDLNEDDHNSNIKKSIIDNDLRPKIKDINFAENLSLFEKKDFDVLKIDVKSDKLSAGNKFFKENYKFENDYDNYHAHVTVAYLNPGGGKKYLTKENSKLIKESLLNSTSIGIVYSSPNGINNKHFNVF